MPYYSNNILDEIRSRINIYDLVSRYVSLKKRGSNYFGLCPFHNEKTPSFSVNPEKGIYKCFGCGKGGDIFSFLMEEENLTFPEAVRSLAGECGVELPTVRQSYKNKEQDGIESQLLAVYRDAAVYYFRNLQTEEGMRAYNYFRGRGLTDETIVKWGLGAAERKSDGLYTFLSKKYSNKIIEMSKLCKYDEKNGWHDMFWNRAMFPIINTGKRVIAFGGRVMGDGTPKYVNSPETLIFNKSKTWFGLNIARSTHKDGFILCEGYMDVIQMHQAGFDNTIASLGTSMTVEHADVLKDYVSKKGREKNVYLSYDSDGAGVRAALRNIDIFRTRGIYPKVINLKPYKDPDEFIKAEGAEEYQKRVDDAENCYLYSIRMRKRKYNLKDPGGLTLFQRMMADDMVLWFDDNLERMNYVKVLCKEYDMPEDDFLALIRKEAARGIKKRSNDPFSPKMKPVPVVRKEKKSAVSTGTRESERLLLMWMADRQDIFDAVADYITPQNFPEGVRRKIAERIFSDRKEGRGTEPVRLLDMFEEPEERQEASDFLELEKSSIPDDIRDWNKAISETLISILKNSESRDKPEPSFKDTIERKKKYEEISKHVFLKM